MQLLSYLKQLRNDTGIFICDKIYIFDYNYMKNDDEQNKAEIEFIQDNPDGIRFVEIFCKDSFSKTNIKDFVKKQNEIIKKSKLIKEELNPDLVIKLLDDYFTEKYGAINFKQVIEDYNISISPKRIKIENHSPSPTFITSPLSDRNDNTFSKSMMINIPKPKKIYIIDGVKCEVNEFEQYLRFHESANVKVTLKYHDKPQVIKYWNVTKFGTHSSLLGNLASGYLRDWKQRGIIGIELEI